MPTTSTPSPELGDDRDEDDGHRAGRAADLEWLPPNSAARIPATIAVTRPASAPRPEVIPNASASGSATTATVTPATDIASGLPAHRPEVRRPRGDGACAPDRRLEDGVHAVPRGRHESVAHAVAPSVRSWAFKLVLVRDEAEQDRPSREQQVPDLGDADRVDDFAAGPPLHDQAGAAQHGELLGQVARLRSRCDPGARARRGRARSGAPGCGSGRGGRASGRTRPWPGTAART